MSRQRWENWSLGTRPMGSFPAMEGYRADVTACRAYPSSLTLPRGDGGRPVTVLANGSPFIYLLDSATGLLVSLLTLVSSPDVGGRLGTSPVTFLSPSYCAGGSKVCEWCAVLWAPPSKPPGLPPSHHLLLPPWPPPVLLGQWKGVGCVRP